jgi:micrococcal nuclease
LGPVRVATIALCTAAFTAAGCAPTDSAPAEDAASTTATIEWVSDGDTLRLTNGRKVRLLQVDAPEHQTDCYGREATRALMGLAPKGTSVILQADSSLDDKDTYGRLLRYVLVDGQNVNLTLVEKGAAAPYFFRNGRGRYAEQLLGAARAARASRHGFWKACPDAELNPGLGSVTGPAAHQRG